MQWYNFQTLMTSFVPGLLPSHLLHKFLWFDNVKLGIPPLLRCCSVEQSIFIYLRDEPILYLAQFSSALCNSPSPLQHRPPRKQNWTATFWFLWDLCILHELMRLAVHFYLWHFQIKFRKPSCGPGSVSNLKAVSPLHHIYSLPWVCRYRQI